MLWVSMVAGKLLRGLSSRNRDSARNETRKRFRGPGWKYVAFCAALLIGPFGWSATAKEAVSWIESYDEALREARRTGKPIFLEFRCAP